MKLVGYTLAAFYVRRRYANPRASLVLFGPARTLLGIAAGGIVGYLCMLAEIGSALPFLLALLPVRVLEWLFVLWLFFGREATTRQLRWWVDAAIGTAWSYGLDAIGIAAAFAVPGGFWVC